VRIGPQTRLILGSASPRRRELLASVGLPFVVLPSDVDEATRTGERPADYLERIVAAKLAGVLEILASARSRDASLGGILVADTIVVAPDGRLLGKPKSDDDARTMIASLDGAAHDVQTRFSLAPCDPGDGPSFAQTVTTRVTFRRLAAGELDGYIACGEGRDKAGAYAVQGRAAAFVESIDGSYTNVVGLPLCQVVAAMRRLGWLT
jgi:septum formation protein